MTDGSAFLAWDDRLGAYDFGPTHPFQMRYRAAAANALRREPGRWRVPDEIPPAPPELLRRFHEGRYLERVEAASRSGRRDPLDQGDTPAFPGCYEAAARVVGATNLGLARLLGDQAAVAFSPSGGLHHAHPDRASGFCIFNDVAVAVASCLGPHGPLSRVAYVDIDAHHGDGVMYGFYGDGRVLDLDLHQDGRTIFPGTGAVGETGRGDGSGLKVNLPLPPGAGDGSLVPLVQRVCVPMLLEFRPELVVLQHGVDGHAGDGLAALEYTDAGYLAALSALLAAARAVSARGVLVTGGGGYHRANVTGVLERAGRLMTGERTPPMWDGPEEPWVEPLVRNVGRALGRTFPDRPGDWGGPGALSAVGP